MRRSWAKSPRPKFSDAMSPGEHHRVSRQAKCRCWKSWFDFGCRHSVTLLADGGLENLRQAGVPPDAALEEPLGSHPGPVSVNGRTGQGVHERRCACVCRACSASHRCHSRFFSLLLCLVGKVELVLQILEKPGVDDLVQLVQPQPGQPTALRREVGLLPSGQKHLDGMTEDALDDSDLCRSGPGQWSPGQLRRRPAPKARTVLGLRGMTRSW